MMDVPKIKYKEENSNCTDLEPGFTNDSKLKSGGFELKSENAK